LLRLVYSNRTEALVRRLIGDLRTQREEAGPFETAMLVVPNRSIETYIRFGIAEADGFAGNIQSLYLSRLVPELLREPDVAHIDRGSLSGFLLSALLDEDFLKAPALSPVRDYLFAAGEAPHAVDLRRFQLATRLAHLFEEYALSRGDLLARWTAGLALAGSDVADVERWERALWLRVLDLAEQRRRRTGTRWIPLPAILDRIRRGQIVLPPRLYVFGLSYVAPFFHALFDAIAQRSELFIYTLNPCRQFWEDVAPRGRRPPEEAPDTPALQLWGRPGRENVHALAEISGHTADEAYEEPGGSSPSLLQQLQLDTLDREWARKVDLHRDSFDFEGDRSLRLLACPSIRREAEGIANEIWSLVQADPSLRFNEIAVIVNARDSDAYFTHLSAAFREAHDLPHNIIGLPFAATSPVAEAVQLLLELPASTFTRSDLLRVATHPVVAARFPEAPTEDWVTWADRLGVFHGADHSDHAGTYIDKDILNWDQGLRRLALGVFLPGPRSGTYQPLELPTGRYLPEEVSQSDHSEASQIGMLIRSLIADARFARSAQLTMEDWGAFLHTLIETYITAESEADKRDLTRCLGALQRAFQLDVDGRRVSFTLAQSIAREALAGLAGGRGQHLAGGVVESTAQPMRAVPFRVVFLAGLGEGKFPAVDQPDQLDLRRAERRAGDVSPRDRDRYVFLEGILSARERLVLSYVARNPITGDKLEWSSVVMELLDVVERHYLENAREKLVEPLPLRRGEAPGSLPEARREADAVALRESWRKTFGDRPIPSGNELLARVSPQSREALAVSLGMTPLPPASVADDSAPLRLSLSHLRTFLECPLQGYAKAILRMRGDEEEDLIDLEDEPFASAGPGLVPLLSEVCLEALVPSTEPDFLKRLEATYDARVEREILSGRMPSGVFGQIDRDAQLRTMQGWADVIRTEIATGGPLRTRIVRFGTADEFARVDQPRPVLSLDVSYQVRGGDLRKRTLHLYGSTSPIVDRPTGSLLLQRADPKRGLSEVRRYKRWLRAFLDHMMLSATGEDPERPHVALLAIPGKSYFARFSAISKDAALRYLADLGRDLLSGPHDYLLPFEAVFDVRMKKAGQYGDSVDRLFTDESSSRGTATFYGPVEDYENLQAPDESTAKAMDERRFGLFFDLLEGKAKSERAA
jgi:exodeoxyribonuclease V gamma subunit